MSGQLSRIVSHLMLLVAVWMKVLECCLDYDYFTSMVLFVQDVGSTFDILKQTSPQRSTSMSFYSYVEPIKFFFWKRSACVSTLGLPFCVVRSGSKTQGSNEQDPRDRIIGDGYCRRDANA